MCGFKNVALVKKQIAVGPRGPTASCSLGGLGFNGSQPLHQLEPTGRFRRLPTGEALKAMEESNGNIYDK